MEVNNERMCYSNTLFTLFWMIPSTWKDSNVWWASLAQKFELNTFVLLKLITKLKCLRLCLDVHVMVMWQNNGLHWGWRLVMACESNVNIRSNPLSSVSPYRLGKLELPRSWHHSKLCPVLQTRSPLLFFLQKIPYSLMTFSAITPWCIITQHEFAILPWLPVK